MGTREPCWMADSGWEFIFETDNPYQTYPYL